jgi:hypothetical protein
MGTRRRTRRMQRPGIHGYGSGATPRRAYGRLEAARQKTGSRVAYQRMNELSHRYGHSPKQPWSFTPPAQPAWARWPWRRSLLAIAMLRGAARLGQHGQGGRLRFACFLIPAEDGNLSTLRQTTCPASAGLFLAPQPRRLLGWRVRRTSQCEQSHA